VSVYQHSAINLQARTAMDIALTAIAPPYDSDTHSTNGVPVPHLLSGVADRQSTESSICWTTVNNMLLVIT
jgi:hypothetical protein